MRNYSNFQRRPAWGNFIAGSIVNKIIVANVIVFFLQQTHSRQRQI